MAALVKALNAKIRSNPVSDYLCSTREFIAFALPLCFSVPDVGQTASVDERRFESSHGVCTDTMNHRLLGSCL